MKMLSILIALVVALSSPSLAGRKGQAGKSEGKRAKAALALKKIDANSNRQIDGAEVAVLKDKFAKAPADSRLKKKLDRNTNGQLDDDELAALNKRFAKAGKAGKDAKGKKAARKAARKGKKKTA
jgi:hypothetical protein